MIRRSISPVSWPNQYWNLPCRKKPKKTASASRYCRERGQRWVAATLNFKNYQELINDNSDWYWEPGLFEDLSWNSTPEAAYPYTSARSLVLQVGYRFCLLQQCYLDTMYRRHPTHAVRAEIMSILVADQESGKILAEFIREQE